MTISVYPSGTIVKMKLADLDGMITCSAIRFDKVQYEVTYFNKGAYETVWMNENEFETNTHKNRIGFKQ